jgi:hypothetical protein
MLAASLVPFAYEKGGPWAALATVVGFCASMSRPDRVSEAWDRVVGHVSAGPERGPLVDCAA